MIRKLIFTIIIVQITFSQYLFAQSWTWMSGSESADAGAVYGIKGIASDSARPGARNGSITWTDIDGNLWMLGGKDNFNNYYNDLWKFDTNLNQWTWMHGDSARNSLAFYGTQGIASVSNTPGSRFNGVGWIDGNNNIWLFGGEGYGSSISNFGRFSDLWKFEIATNQWTWVKGPSAEGVWGVYGNIGVPSNNNNPGARYLSNGWYYNNKLYLYGGDVAGNGIFGDLWTFDILTNNWTWLKGANTASEIPVYGSLGLSNNLNLPGARSGVCTWSSNNGELFLFGGSNGTSDFYADIWKYNVASNQWTWIKGPNVPNTSGVYGITAVPSSNNNPGSRYKSTASLISNKYLMLFGGYGLAQTGPLYYLNDLWRFDLVTYDWTFIKGGTLSGQNGIYGLQGVSNAINCPGAREYHSSWDDHNGNFWLFGGWGFDENLTFGRLNDLWKFYQPKISGYVWNDLNNNCLFEQTETGVINGLPLVIQPGNIVTVSNNGFWRLDSLAAGTYTISVDTTNSNWIPTCPITQTFTVVHQDSFLFGPNFGFISAFPCASPNVDIIMPRMRRGFSNQLIYLQACNENTATGILDSAYTIVQLPAQISVQSASLPYTALGNNRFRFELGAINPGQCINFTLNTTVTIAAVANQTLCMSAELFPQADCVFDSIPTPYDDSPSGSVTPCNLPWDRSSLRVEGECVGDSVRFVIYNTGSFGGGDMDCFAPVRVYVDGQWVMLDSIRIVGGDSVVFMFAGTGGTIRLEADQHPLHPGNSHPNASVENCGNGTWTPGQVITLPQDDADPIIDIFCGQVSAPYDPNDKTGFPLGVGTNHNIRQNQQIEYLIRFQNIGTDTAVNVVIRDTLTTDLNIFTVQSGVASHPYEFRMYGPRILEWKFNNIMLPDSNVNEPASNGFVKFTVEQNPDLAFGTVIENSAAIYFDFEAPVITNTYFHTIHDFSISVSVEPIEGANKYVDVKVIPNPFRNQATLQLEGLENTDNLELEIFNLSGQRVQYLNNSQNAQFQISRGEMSQGIYFFSVKQGNKVVARGKMVVE